MLKFDDIKGLPSNVTGAYLYLYSLPRGTSLPSQVALFRATSFWDKTVQWGDLNITGVAEPYYTTPPSKLPTLGTPGFAYSPLPGINTFYGMGITDWYNGWKNGTYANHGIVIYPNDGNNNQFDYFVSSNSMDDGKRPILRLDFTPPVTVPSFKMPLPGNIRWLVTTEVGGHDCKGLYDSAHDGSNYFSIDFSWRNKDMNGNPKYTSENADIPVIAAAGGTIQTFPNDPYNGNRVDVTHGTTGFLTRYAHLKSIAPGINGVTVAQGDLLGYMGTTGTDPNTGLPTSTGVHLHFGVKYNGSGAEATNIRYAVMDGWILKSFQTECLNNDYIRYYTSSNRVYP